jgi:importin subunit beta-1
MPLSNQDPDVLSVRADEILTAVVHGARKEEPSTDVQLAAMQALYNSLSFVRENFEREVCALAAVFFNLS